MSFPRYPKYKDSGVDWLGEVPTQWDVKALKWLSPVLRGASPRPIDDVKYFDDEGEYGWVRIADASASNGLLLETTQRLSELGSSLSVKLEPDTLFVSIAGTVGKPCITGMKACIHDGFVYFPRLQVDQRWLYRLFESGACYAGLGKMGTQLNLNTDTIGSIRIAVPPLAELQALLAFLDRETAKIDALIAEQERLIALLKEKRQALISHAVTKGLDPNVAMKDSGIEWLGQVPAHWDVFPLKRDIQFLTSGARGWAAHYADEGALFVRIGNLTRDGIGLDLADIQRVSVPEGSEGERTKVAVGDLLFSITAYLGSVAVASDDLGPAYVSQHIALARLALQHFAPHWIAYVTLSMIGKNYLDMQAYGGTKIQLGLDDIANMPATAPPLKEQHRIVSFLGTETGKLDALIREVERAITLLKERRSTLISAAVTGKIDVRNVATTEVDARGAEECFA